MNAPTRDALEDPIRAGSRPSQLAMIQVAEVFQLLADQGVTPSYILKTYPTRGDKDLMTPLTANPADDFFTDTLDQALLDGEIDVAIHSAKDLPQTMPEGLMIAALTAPLDETDSFIGACRLADLPAGARIGTSSLIRQEGVKQINPQVELAAIRGNIHQRIQQLKSGRYDGIIAATCALKRLGLEQQITEILPWEGAPLQGQLAVVVRADHSVMRKFFTRIDIRKVFGRVTLVGAGPGDPDLISVRGIKALQQAECVFYDYLVHPDLLWYAPHAEKISAGKRKGRHTLSQKELSRRLREKAMAGKRVVRLKGGDPFIFGRGAEEMSYLKAYHIEVEVVPGISSATGIPSSLGIPLTARGISSSVAFVSGHADDEHQKSSHPIAIPDTDTVVFLMGLSKLAMIVQGLRTAGWEGQTPMMIVSKGTRLDEQLVTGTLDNIVEKSQAEHSAPPALIIAGRIVAFANNISQTRPGVLYTGTNPEKYRHWGRIIHHPMITIQERPLTAAELQMVQTELRHEPVILMTSRFAVYYFLKELIKHGVPVHLYRHLDYAVIGEDTARALSPYGILPRVTACQETSEGMLAAMVQTFSLNGRHILFPRSSMANPYLKEELSRQGSVVAELPVYDNLKPQKRDLPGGRIEAVIFTSPSTVRNFLDDYGEIPRSWRIFSKGPHTQRCLAAKGYLSEILVPQRKQAGP
jgi:uroporphyrinogen III methyltransferase/synthase